MIIWINLNHDNVLPCLGFAEHNNLPALVSEWMENGNVIDYLAKNRDIDRVIVVCASSLALPDLCPDIIGKAKGIASGLKYIHGEGVVHSDLKGVCIISLLLNMQSIRDF